jgi:8-amino-7-oxononanoate synthase
VDIFKKCATSEQMMQANKVKEMGYYPFFKPVAGAEDTEVMIEGKKRIMLGSNNYLGLTTHPHVVKSAVDAVEKYGSSSCGSRFLNGTLDIHLELEDRLAKFLKRESALVFSTGFQTNLGTISAIVAKGDIIICDKLNHASIYDGARLSDGTMKRFRHNDVENLEQVLKDCPTDVGKIIVIDGLFSMEGDLCPLPEIVELSEKYGCRIMVDDAHGMGVMGENGRGTPEHFDLEDRIDLVMGTFSKSFASLGGVIAGEKYVIDYIQHMARSMIFSASMPPSAVAAVLAVIDVMESEPERRTNLWKNSSKMLKGLKDLGFDTGDSESPVIPIVVGELFQALEIWKTIFEKGVFVNMVLPPAVPQDRVLLRTSYMATHTDQQLDQALSVFEDVGKQFGLI